METSFQDKITQLKSQVTSLQKSLRKERSKQVDSRVEKSELEKLFLKAIDDTKKSLVRRKLTTELGRNST